jgi:hypothetical protein
MDWMGIDWRTFWAAVSAIGTLFGAAALWFAVRRLRLDGWLKAQEVFTDDGFTRARGQLFARLDNRECPWTDDERSNGLAVCRKMEELAALATYFPRKTILREWGDPIAKAWLLLEPLVREERLKSNWDDKWYAFENLGKTALRKRPYLRR